MQSTINDLKFDGARIPFDHDFGWTENVIAREALPKKWDHDAEHEDMLTTWGCDPSHTSKLSLRTKEDGEPYMDRLYHVMLHLRFWKDNPERFEHLQQFVQRFEEQSGYSLDELRLPNPQGEGKSVY